MYKKAERLAKAIHLITPAFSDSLSLRNRIGAIAMGLVDASLLPPNTSRMVLSRELLALSSVLSIARTGGLLSSMNTDLITREAHILLQEVAAYEEPRLFLDAMPTLSGIARGASAADTLANQKARSPRVSGARKAVSVPKGHLKDTHNAYIKDRREAVLSVIRHKGSVHIKDISTLIRGVSEKTIQRELSSLVVAGLVLKQGERRWSTYSLV